jgi:hypothetical protein
MKFYMIPEPESDPIERVEWVMLLTGSMVLSDEPDIFASLASLAENNFSLCQ